MKPLTKLLAVIFFSACAAILPAHAETALGISGNLEFINQSGVHEGDIYRNLIRADLNLDENFGDTILHAVLRAEDDTIRPEDDGTNYLRSDDTGPQRVFLYEGYISHDLNFENYIDSINFKLGRIIYTWGNADDEKPTDIINPQDMSNIYFTLMQPRKISVYSGSVSVYVNENIFFEGVMVPESRPSEIASSEFTTRQLLKMRENPFFNINDPENPEHENSENSYACRAGFMLFDIDMHASYFYGYDHIPVYVMKFNPSTFMVDTTPEYKKIQMFGFDFQRALFLGMTLRGEAAYFERGKYFYYDSDSSSGDVASTPMGQDILSGGTGSVEKDCVMYTAGFDDHSFIIDDLYFNLQLNHRIIIDSENSMEQKGHVLHVLWSLKYFMFNRNLCISTRGAYNIGDVSVYGNAEVMVKPSDSLELALGTWIIEGDHDSEIGQFDAYDMVYLSGKLVF